MSVYKDDKRNSCYCKCNYKEWLGESKSKMKRGFAAKKDAQQWEHDFLQKQSANMDIKFTSYEDCNCIVSFDCGKWESGL